MARRRLTTQEEELWKLATRDVSPLAHRPAPLVADPATGRLSAKEIRERRRSALLDGTVSAANFAASLPASPTPAVTPPNRQWARRLKRGEMEVEARIDLHGLTEIVAHRRLLQFVGDADQMGLRRLLVITGKGRNGQGILRSRLLDWLSSGAVASRVMAVHPAHVKDGGDGAFYVVLRRFRGE